MSGDGAGGGTTLDADAVRRAVDGLRSSSERVHSASAAVASRAFGPDLAGRNYRTEAAALADGIDGVTRALDGWSAASRATVSAIRRSVEESLATDVVSASGLTAAGEGPS